MRLLNHLCIIGQTNDHRHELNTFRSHYSATKKKSPKLINGKKTIKKACRMTLDASWNQRGVNL